MLASISIIFVSIIFPSIVAFSTLFYTIEFLESGFISSLSIQYGFDDKDLIEYDLKKYLTKKGDEGEKRIKDVKEGKNFDETIKEKTNKEDNEINRKEEMIDKKDDNSNAKEIEKIFKSYYEFFENLLLYIDPIQFFIKAKELSKDLFDLFEELKNRKENEWITYRIQELKLKKWKKKNYL